MCSFFIAVLISILFIRLTHHCLAMPMQICVSSFIRVSPYCVIYLTSSSIVDVGGDLWSRWAETAAGEESTWLAAGKQGRAYRVPREISRRSSHRYHLGSRRFNPTGEQKGLTGPYAIRKCNKVQYNQKYYTYVYFTDLDMPRPEEEAVAYPTRGVDRS